MILNEILPSLPLGAVCVFSSFGGAVSVRSTTRRASKLHTHREMRERHCCCMLLLEKGRLVLRTRQPFDSSVAVPTASISLQGLLCSPSLSLSPCSCVCMQRSRSRSLSPLRRDTRAVDVGLARDSQIPPGWCVVHGQTESIHAHSSSSSTALAVSLSLCSPL